MIVSSYARVSTQRQENEETIETQIMAIKDYAAKNGHTIIKEYRDEGWSGTILARPNLDELRLDARKKLWVGVILYDPDRLARKYAYQSLVIEELEEQGIKVLFVTTPPAKTDEDKLLYGVKGIFAEYERARITDRFRLGKLRKAREGNVVTTEAPYGYTYIPKQGKKDGYYEVNEREAEVVKMIFGWVANEGYTIRRVVLKLQELGIPPKRSKKGVWNTSTLGTLLRSTAYIGVAQYNRSYAVVPEKPLKFAKYKRVKKSSKRWKPTEEWIDIPTVPQIIEKDLFEKARQQLKLNFERCKRNRKNEYLLSGLIYCTCGRRRAGEGPQHGKHLYYRCTDRVMNFPLPPSCAERGINARIADSLVWDRVRSFMNSPQLMKHQLERWIAKKDMKSNTSEKTIGNLRAEFEKIKKEEQRYIKIYGAELITIDQFEETINDLKVKRSAIEKQIGHFQTSIQDNSIVTPSSDTIDEFVSKSKRVLQNLSFEAKQKILQRCIQKIIANQREMTVYGYLPLEQEVGLYAKSRDYRSPKCGEEYAFQCTAQKAGGGCGAVSFLYHRAKRGCGCSSRQSSGTISTDYKTRGAHE